MSYQIGGAGDAPTPSLRRPQFNSVAAAMNAATAAMAAKRYAEVIVAMESVALLSVKALTPWQGYALGLGYRNVMRDKRNIRKKGLKIAKHLEKGEFRVESVKIRELIRRKEEEMDMICRDAKYIINVHVLLYATSSSEKVFYHLLLGDLYRYRCEGKSCSRWAEISADSLDEYEWAYGLALQDVPGKCSLRLKLALNYSILCHDILDKSERARDIIETALEAASGELNDVCKKLVKILNHNLNILGPAAAAGGRDEVAAGVNVEANVGVDINVEVKQELI